MSKAIVPYEIIEKKIYLIRGKKVMLDRDLSGLYEVEVKYLNRQVDRNKERFPEDFMFRLTKKEFDILRCQNVTSSWGGRRYMPFVFTEYGILMLSSVLNSKRAIHVNIQIMRAFTKLREMVVDNKELRKKIEEMEKKYDGQFKVVLEAIKCLMSPLPGSNKRIGFMK